MRKLPLIVLSSLTLVLSCNENRDENINSGDIKINLKTKFKDNPHTISYFTFRFKDTIPPNFKGFVRNDKSFLGYITTINKRKPENQSILSSSISKESSPYELFCLSGITSESQYYVFDGNMNKDFSDDQQIHFRKGADFGFAQKDSIEKLFPLFKLNVSKLYNNTFFDDTVGLRVFPNSSFFHYRDKSKDSVEELKRKLLLATRFEDYYEGLFSLNNIKYKVALNKYGVQGYEFIFEEHGKSYKTYKNPFREIYKIKDTLKITNQYFRIDTITHSPPVLEIKRLDTIGDYYGSRTGDRIKNYQLQDLNLNPIALKDLFKDKKYLLLDFWGTWCGPCKELTPDLVQLNKQYGDSIGFVSMAFQLDIAPVKEYVFNNKMDWNHIFLKGKPKTLNPDVAILKDLRIMSYPTFILLDKDLNILFKGSGYHFEQLKDFINSTVLND